MSKKHPFERPMLTPSQIEQLRALDGCPDTAGIPEAPVGNWAGAHLFRLRKEAISLRLDEDVLD